MRKVFLFVLLLISLPIFSQSKKLNFEFDYARFNYDSLNVYVEIYYSLNQNNLKVITNSENNKAVQANINFKFIDLKNNKTVLDKSWDIENIINEGSTNLNNLVGQLGLYFKSGNYKVIATAYDKNAPETKKIIEDELKIDAFPKDKLSISDIELSSKIIKEGANKNSIFYKNTLEVIPNPEMLYSNVNPVAFFYAEIYNIKNHSNSNLQLHEMLYKGDGVKVYSKKKEIGRTQSDRVEVGFINLRKYPTGSYNLVLALVDDNNKQAYASNKKFFLFNPGVKDTFKVERVKMDHLASEFSGMEMEECDDFFAKSKYIATQDEIDQYEKIDSLNAKREFLYKFWKKRDLTPETPQNEYKKEYFERVAEANRLYSSFTKKGWKSDRGRVYVLYGKPDQLDRYPNENDKKPYEIWTYEGIEGGVLFIFGDLSGFGDYDLLHSTKRDELQDERWESKLIQKMY